MIKKSLCTWLLYCIG